MAVHLKSILLMTRNLPNSIRFYNEGLGLPVLLQTERWAELGSEGGRYSKLMLQQADAEAVCTTGYSPFLCFNVGVGFATPSVDEESGGMSSSSSSFDQTIYRLLQMGGVLDGPIKYPVHGKVAVLRSPDGHMLSLFESAMRKPAIYRSENGPAAKAVR